MGSTMEESRVTQREQKVSEINWSAVTEGDKELLFRVYYPRVIRFFMRRSGLTQAIAAEDLAQDVFIRVFRGFGTFENLESFESWLMKIARNIYLNEVRSSQSKKRKAHTVEIFENDEALEKRDLSPDPEEVALNRETMSILRQAIDDLPTKMRLCILMWYSGKRMDEIAGILHVEIGTVKSHLFAARQRIKSYIKARQRTVVDF